MTNNIAICNIIVDNPKKSCKIGFRGIFLSRWKGVFFDSESIGYDLRSYAGIHFADHKRGEASELGVRETIGVSYRDPACAVDGGE